MNKQDEFINNLSEEKKTILLAHFNNLRRKKLKKLTKEEYKIIYLAHIWKNGMVTKGQDGFYAFDEVKAGIPLSDYEDIYYWEGIYFPGSYHLESIHTQYELDRLMEIL
jgi:hypothetical protein